MVTVSETISDLATQLSGLAKSSSSDAEKRSAAAVIARQILLASKGPFSDWMVRAFNSAEAASLRLLLDWGAFEVIPMEGTISYTELAKKLEADFSLVRRLCWVLVSGDILRQHGNDQVAHTDISKQYLPEHPNGWDEHLVPTTRMPDYFEQYGRREPAGRLHTPHAFSHGQPDKDIWEIQKQNPERMKRFMKAMEVTQNWAPLVGIYDFKWIEPRLSEDKNRVVLVDVGGGKGHAIKAILDENPFLPADRMVLEDRDEIIAEVAALKEPELKSVRLQVHDFHQPQPVKNALFYWIRRCLHDYGDDVCAQMLRRLSDAMAQDSKLLIVEYVLPNPPPPMAAMTDFGMMNIGGKERTTEDWATLVARSGLRIEKIHGLKKRMQVLECVKTSDGAKWRTSL
ncbi:Methyltransferase fsa4 [Colletotrichum trifolii]|uniref:Methyltransferase fsa4 n=1 Tax=Colletotrichum trifolii TaxID=5466 RepID=A0A4R8QNV1_COLTR|nr:Methyltransferase fsa4 [Colletotrichum trifolii]